MNVEFSFFVGAIISFWLFLAFCLESIINKSFDKIKKHIYLVKRKCQICSQEYFVSKLSNYWNCPFCDSINKEK